VENHRGSPKAHEYPVKWLHNHPVSSCNFNMVTWNANNGRFQRSRHVVLGSIPSFGFLRWVSNSYPRTNQHMQTDFKTDHLDRCPRQSFSKHGHCPTLEWNDPQWGQPDGKMVGWSHHPIPSTLRMSPSKNLVLPIASDFLEGQISKKKAMDHHFSREIH